MRCPTNRERTPSLDTDISSAHLKRPAGLMHRFAEYSGRLHVPTMALGELYVWAHNRPSSVSALHRIENDLLADVIVLNDDAVCAREFGRIRAQLLPQGISVPSIDLMIASRLQPQASRLTLSWHVPSGLGGPLCDKRSVRWDAHSQHGHTAQARRLSYVRVTRGIETSRRRRRRERVAGGGGSWRFRIRGTS